MNENKTQKTYNFSTFLCANLAAKRIVEMGGENVRLKSRSSGFSVSFVSSWKVEASILPLDLPCKEDCRTGIKWTQEEYGILVDAYMSWHSIDDIADKVHRRPNSIVAALARQGYLDRANSLQDAWDDTWPEPNYNKFLFDSKGLLDRFYLLDAGIMSEERAYGVDSISVADLTQEEINVIFKFLMWFDRWSCASRFSLELGDPLRAFRLARQGENMLLALKALHSVPNLPQMYSDQRDMLNGFFRKKIINDLPLAMERWVAAAKLRDPGQPHEQGGRPTYPIDAILDTPREDLPDDLLALMGNSAELEGLVKKGNKLAACFLADIQWQKMWADGNYCLNADAAARKIQDDYWPTKHEIETLLRKHLPFDEKLAHKLSHVSTSAHHNWAKEKRSYYKYHLLMSHKYHHPKWGIVQEESDDFSCVDLDETPYRYDPQQEEYDRQHERRHTMSDSEAYHSILSDRASWYDH